MYTWLAGICVGVLQVILFTILRFTESVKKYWVLKISQGIREALLNENDRNYIS